MHTVINSRPAAAPVALGESNPGTPPDPEGRADFAALVAEHSPDKTPLEEVARSDAQPSAAMAAMAMWSAPTLVKPAGGDEGDGSDMQSGALSAFPAGAALTPTAEPGVPAAAGPTFGLATGTDGLAAGGGVSTGPAPAAAADAQALAAAEILRFSTGSGSGVAAAASDGGSGAIEHQFAPADANLAGNGSSALAQGAGAGQAGVPGASLPDAALAAVGLRPGQGRFSQDNAPAGTRDSLPTAAAPTSADLAASPPAIQADALMAPSTGLVARLAETALLSLFAAQAEAASLDPAAGGAGFSPWGTLSALAVASPAVGSGATVPHLAAQLAQVLTRHSDGTTELALSPDELGHVRVTLQADALNPDRLVVMLNFERPETLDLFRRHADQLADALRDAGFSGAEIGFGQSDSGSNRNSRPQEGFTDQPARSAELTASVVPDQPAPRLTVSSTLDLRL